MQMDEVFDDVLVPFYDDLGCAGPVHINNGVEVRVNG